MFLYVLFCAAILMAVSVCTCEFVHVCLYFVQKKFDTIFTSFLICKGWHVLKVEAGNRLGRIKMILTYKAHDRIT